MRLRTSLIGKCMFQAQTIKKFRKILRLIIIKRECEIMRIPECLSTRMAKAQAHDYVKNNHAQKPQEFSVDGKIYKVINNQVIRMNPCSGMAKCREAVRKIAYMRLPTHSFSNDLTQTLRVAKQNSSTLLRNSRKLNQTLTN
ncbi:targeted effector protein kinase [Vibrio sp. AND4]|nr:targeted effector protein kinase [Vibrio sp. AND4]